MGLAVATYSLTLVVAAFPFLLSLGQAFFVNAQGHLTAAFMLGLGEWFFIGITLSIASVLIAIDTVFDSGSRRSVPLLSEFAIWSAICGLACLGCFTVYTLVKGHLADSPSLQNFMIAGSLLVVVVTVGVNAFTYVKVRIWQIGPAAQATV